MFYVIIYEYTFQSAKVQKKYEIRNLLSVFSGQPHQNFVNSLRMAQIRGML